MSIDTTAWAESVENRIEKGMSTPNGGEQYHSRTATMGDRIAPVRVSFSTTMAAAKKYSRIVLVGKTKPGRGNEPMRMEQPTSSYRNVFKSK